MSAIPNPKESYAKLALDSSRWLGQAAALEYVAKSFEADITAFWETRLFPERTSPTDKYQYAPYVMDVHLMLMGFAIENLLKSGMVKLNGGEYYSEVLKTGRLPKQLKTHNLVELAEAIGFPLDSNLRRLLKRLEISLTTTGRYPVHLSWDNPSDPDVQLETLESEDVGDVRHLLKEIAIHLGRNPDNLFEGAS